MYTLYRITNEIREEQEMDDYLPDNSKNLMKSYFIILVEYGFIFIYRNMILYNRAVEVNNVFAPCKFP